MQYDAIENFLARAKKLTKSQAKDMRLTLEEVSVLSIELAALLAERSKNQTVRKTAPVELINLIMDGGSMKG